MSLMERPAPGLARRWLWLLLLISGMAACGDAAGPPPPPPPQTTATVTGTVRSSVDGAPVAGATCSIGNRSSTTGTDGGFQLERVAPGPTTLTCSRSGFEAYSASVNIQAGENTHQVMLSVRETFGASFHTIFVPARAATIHGVIIAIGGPDTRCFADPRLSCATAGVPLEIASRLQLLGSNYRQLATSMGLAIVGGPVGGEDLVNALSIAAVTTQRPELATAPFLAHGMSGGGPAVYRLVMNNPGRAAGLILKVAAPPFQPADPAPARSVPALMIIAGGDDPQWNSFNRSLYGSHRAAGGLWAFAEEPGQPHISLTVSVQELYLSWITSILEQRLPATPGEPLRTIAEESGWLGNPVTFDIASWPNYVGDRSTASWLPSQEAATIWRRAVRPGS